MTYIHELADWPNMRWDDKSLSTSLAALSRAQGQLLGRMQSLGFEQRQDATLDVLTTDIIKSNAIEGEHLNPEQVRSSVAKRLGLSTAGLPVPSRYIDGVVEMLLDATQHYREPLTKERLWGWHAALFPEGHSGMHKIEVATWRSGQNGPMQIVSGPVGREKVHFQAPEAVRLDQEMTLFLDWFNGTPSVDMLLKAAIAHFWFVVIHPFEDGNGRIGRAIADMCLARADNTSDRFCSLSAGIEQERKSYYAILESSSQGGLDITRWLQWFFDCLQRVIGSADVLLDNVLRKSRLWNQLATQSVNERQRKILNKLLGDFSGNLTTSKYAKMAKCSRDTALRDLEELIGFGVIERHGSGRSVTYHMVERSQHLKR